jgi:hypothetical protein
MRERTPVRRLSSPLGVTKTTVPAGTNYLPTDFNFYESDLSLLSNHPNWPDSSFKMEAVVHNGRTQQEKASAPPF